MGHAPRLSMDRSFSQERPNLQLVISFGMVQTLRKCKLVAKRRSVGKEKILRSLGV